MVGMDAV